MAQKLDLFQAPISKQLVSTKAATPATYQSEHPFSSRQRRLREKHLSKETSSVNRSSEAAREYACIKQRHSGPRSSAPMTHANYRKTNDQLVWQADAASLSEALRSLSGRRWISA